VRRLAEFVTRHHEPVSQLEFQLLAVAILLTAIGIIGAGTYNYLVVDAGYCLSGDCDPDAGPSVNSPRRPVDRDAVPAQVPAQLDAELPSWRRG
jgi:hypothetical protein